jgi:hypothetical protein
MVLMTVTSMALVLHGMLLLLFINVVMPFVTLVHISVLLLVCVLMIFMPCVVYIIHGMLMLWCVVLAPMFMIF